MKYDAITIDTNIFKRYQNRLETSILAGLNQFEGMSIDVVLSEVVVKELRRHLVEDSNNSVEVLKKITEGVHPFHSLPEDVIKTIKSLDPNKYNPKEIAEKRLEKFLEICSAKIITSDTIGVNDIIEHYFEVNPPFEKEGKKKKEFPDAIALLSLEKWAKQNNKKILAFSMDNGWQNYAKQSKRIDVEEDLAEALKILGINVRGARKIISKLLGELSEGKYTNISDKIKYNIEELIESRSPYVEIECAPSAGVCLADLNEIICKKIEFLKDQNGNFRFVVAGIEANKITVKIPLELEVKVFVSGSFYASSEHIYLTTTSETRDIEMDLSILITFEGDFKNSFSSLSAKDISIVEKYLTIDIGHVDPF